MDDNNQTPSGAAALDEIEKIQKDPAHPDHAAWVSSDPVALKKVSELWRASSTENGETAEPKPLAAEPEKKDEPEDSENAGEAKAEKERGQDQLKVLWGEGDAYEQKAEAAGRTVHALIDFGDDQDVAIFDAFDARIGNNPQVADYLAQIADKIPQGKRKIDLTGISTAERDRLAGQADAFLFQGAFRKAMPEGNEMFTNWLAKIGVKLFTPPEPVEPSDAKPAAPVDPKKAKAAQTEIDQIYSGKHKLSEAWKKGEPAARRYLSSLFQALTNGK